MESKIYRGLAEAYAEVYASEETEQLDEMGQVMTTGQRTAPKAAPRTPQPYRPGGGRQAYNQRRSGITQTAKPAPTARPTATAPTSRPTAMAPTSRPTATAPTSRPTATAPTSRPVAPTQKASPSPTTSTSAPAAAPKRTFNPLMQKTFGYQTGYAPSQVKGDIKKMAQMGSLKASFDMFDLVKGHLLDEGYADTEEAAIAIMANMSEEWRESILDEADSLAAMQARREKRLKAQRKREGTTVTGRDFGRDDRLTSDQQKARRDAEYKEGTKK